MNTPISFTAIASVRRVLLSVILLFALTQIVTINTALAQELPYAFLNAKQPVSVINASGSAFPTYNVNEVITDENGNTFVTGFFKGTCDFDPNESQFNLVNTNTTGANNDMDAFMAKYDPDGNLVFAKAISGLGEATGLDILISPTGKIYVVGRFSGSANFDPGVTNFTLASAGATDGFFARYLPNGTFETAATSGGAGVGEIQDITRNTTLTFISGVFQGTLDFDLGVGVSELTSVGVNQSFVAAYDDNFVFQWVDALPGLISEITSDASSVYTTGNFTGTADFDPKAPVLSKTSRGLADAWISKLNGTNGDLVWNKAFGGTSNDYGLDVVVDGSSNIYLTGHFTGDVDLDSKPIYSNGQLDGYLAKFTSLGAVEWVRSWGGNQFDYAYNIALLQNNTVMVAGAFNSGSFDADPGAGITMLTNTKEGTSDAYFINFNATGGFGFANSFGGPFGEIARVKSNGNRFTVYGYFNTAFDFDPSTDVNQLTTSFQHIYIASYAVVAAVPSAQPTALNFSGQTASSITSTYTAAAGANGYVVMRKPNSATTFAPKDGKVYITGNSIGDAVVAYSGPATTFTNSGLAAGTTYFYSVYAYSTSGGVTNYRTAAPLSGTTSTLTLTATRTTDSLALVAIYNAANGPGWTNRTNWLTGPINTWYGVTVTANRVTALNLNSNQLNGTLSPMVGNLTAVTDLQVCCQQLTGNIPPELGKLTNLTYLDLSPNQFIGSIPPEIGNLTKIKTLWMNNNKLTGAVPAELGNLALLENLYLQGNQLSGSIPAQLGNLSNLKELHAQSNQFTGPIPPQLGNLAKLKKLFLSANKLSGAIPSQLGNLAQLEQLELWVNQLSGAIPPELGGLPLLKKLSLTSNQLTGSIPTQLSNLSSLEVLELQVNQLTGGVPASFTNLTNLQALLIHNNQLSILPNLSGLSVTNFNCSNNNFTFEDLEPNVGISGIVYTPQNIVGVDQLGIAASGGPLNLSFTVGGSANTYQWVKGTPWNNIPGATNATYSLPTTTPNDAGFYYLVVNNSLVPGLQLNSAMREVRFEGDFYWIGNGGTWNDPAHWALNSGDTSAGFVPGPYSDVNFDANSFTLLGQIVEIPDDGSLLGVNFKTMDWRGVTNNPTFQIKTVTSDWIENHCTGSIYFADNMTVDFLGAEFHMLSEENYEFDTRGHNLGQNSWLAFNFNTQLIPTIKATVLSDINNSRIYVYQGTLDLGGHDFLGHAEAYPAIWLNGTVDRPVVMDISNSAVDIGTLQINVGNTLIDDNAEITIRNGFTIAASQNFNHVKLVGTISLANAARNNTFGTLEILPGSDVQLRSEATQTITNFIANGTEAQPIKINATVAGARPVISKAIGTVNAKYVHLKDIAATGGATFNAINSWDDGNNTGWSFEFTSDVVDSLALVSLYQNTNGGSWTRKTNWLTSKASLWEGVTFTRNNVTAVSLPNNNLVGTVPEEFTNMDSLETINLSGNEITTIPDFTSLPALTTLNISNNSLDFASLESNASLIGDVIYENQAAVTESSYTEIPVNTNTTLTASVGGSVNQYQWKFKGSNLPGATTDSYTISAISRATMGDYTLEIINPLVPALVLNSGVFTVAATADISGTLYAAEAEPATAGEMLLLKVTESGGYDTIRHIGEVNGNGTYLFDNVVLDDYLINGWADTLVYEKSIPTWYQQTIYWEEADTLKLENNEVGLDIVSTERPEHPTAGLGSISGTVFETIPDPQGKGNAAVARVAKAAATVRRVERAGREDDETLTLVDYVFTNDDGEFNFAKLDGGAEYRLNIQYPGYPMDETSFITIPVGTTLFDRQVGVEAEVKNGKINVRKLVITGWEEEQHDLQAYPNPTVDFIYVKNTSEVPMEFNLVDGSGKSIAVSSEWNDSDKRWELDIRTIETGIFILQIKQKNRTDKLKVIVQ